MRILLLTVLIAEPVLFFLGLGIMAATRLGSPWRRLAWVCIIVGIAGLVASMIGVFWALASAWSGL